VREYSREIEIPATADWKIIYEFGELNLPPFPVQRQMDHGDVATDLGVVHVRVDFDNPDTGNVDVDFIVLPKSEEFIAILLGEFDLDDSGDVLEIDAWSGAVFRKDSASAIYETWRKYGTPLSQLIMRGGWDYRLRFIAFAGSDGMYQATATMAVTVYGLYATVYPFEEA
jgi:hypothetical protein